MRNDDTPAPPSDGLVDLVDPAFHKVDRSRDCEHGQLARSCVMCDQAAEIERLKEQKKFWVDAANRIDAAWLEQKQRAEQAERERDEKDDLIHQMAAALPWRSGEDMIELCERTVYERDNFKHDRDALLVALHDALTAYNLLEADEPRRVHRAYYESASAALDAGNRVSEVCEVKDE